MSMHTRIHASFLCASLWAALSLALPLAATAQQAPAASSSQSGANDMSSTDMGSMHDMHMPAHTSSAPTPATASTAGLPPNVVKGNKKADKPAKPGAVPRMAPQAMPPPQAKDMAGPKPKPKPAMEGMQATGHGSMHHGGAQGSGSMGGMPMGPMQGGSPPPDARSPDYSDGIGYGPALGLHEAMDDNAKLGMLLLDQLEAFHGKDGNGQTWEAQGWYGTPSDKLWVRTGGERSGGKLEDGDIEAFWNHTIATFWNTQLGARHDLGGPSRNWAAFGIQGLAPYWFEIEATGYVGPSGRTSARLRAEYELLFTQRLILQPEFEVNAYGKSDPARRIGSGVSDASFGLRLRYEIRRQFAPYVGVVWTRRFGGTADFARQNQESIFDRQWVAGVRIWF